MFERIDGRWQRSTITVDDWTLEVGLGGSRGPSSRSVPRCSAGAAVVPATTDGLPYPSNAFGEMESAVWRSCSTNARKLALNA